MTPLTGVCLPQVLRFYGERTPWWLLVRATGPTG